MAQSAPPKDKMDNSNASAQLLPPDERFWQRYSPHAEFPLSSAGSFVLHLLLLGILLLAAFLSALFFSNGNRSLPIEAVRLDLGGGGGNPKGVGDGPNQGQPIEAGSQHKEAAEENPTVPDAPKLDVPPSPKVKQEFKDDNARFLEAPKTEQEKIFQKLGDIRRPKRAPDNSGNPSGKGKGGTGKGGGSGSGDGTGVGSGKGEGRGDLTQREKRMLRWSMLFNTINGQNYVDQLRGLGAILAIPVRESGNDREYKIISDLSARPARLEDKDITQIQRIYWIDDKPQSVSDVLTTLGVQLPTRPSHFVAFMPEELEAKLYRLEKEYLNKHYRGKTEDNIIETKFQIRFRGGKYEPEVKSGGLRVK